MVESRREQIKDIARWLNIPPHKLGDDSKASFSSLEQENRSYVDSTLSPYFHAIADECELKLLSLEEREQRRWFFEFDSSELLQTDLASLYDLGVKGVNNRLVTTNEWRWRVGMNPVEFGDTIQGPANVMVVGNTEVPDRQVIIAPLEERLELAIKGIVSLIERKSKSPAFRDWYKSEFPITSRKFLEDHVAVSLRAFCYVTRTGYSDSLERLYNSVAKKLSAGMPATARMILSEEGFYNGQPV
jgi:hypothetical protein